MPLPDFSLQIIKKQFHREYHFYSAFSNVFLKLMLFIYKCFLSILKEWKTSGFLLSFLAYWWFAFRYALWGM